jgi:hypothetical protein
MPDTSPLLGLPIAKGIDPVKSYPASVDSPRTLALERYTVIPLASAAARAAAIPTPTVGMVTYLQDTKVTEQWTGAAWKRLTPPEMAGGTAVPGISGTGGITVAFGRTFSAVPVVVATVGDEATGIGYIQVAHSGVTTTQFAARVLNRSGVVVTSGNVRINWIAFVAATFAATLLPTEAD